MSDDVAGGAGRRTVSSATCLGCGCACDDIDVVVEGERIVDPRNACSLGRAWFGDGRVPARAAAGGRDATVDAALDAAAALLAGARRPLVYLAPDVTSEAQREGVAIADLLHAALDSVTSATAMGSVLAAQERGRAGATLGEVRNRGDVIVFWGVDPLRRYPRYPTRYAPEPTGMWVPEGRRSRTVVAVDVGSARGPADADRRVAVAAEDEVATLTALGALVGDAPPADDQLPEGAAWARARELAPVLRGARYAVIVADAEPADDDGMPDDGMPNDGMPNDGMPDDGMPDESAAGDGARDPGRAGALVALSQALAGSTRGALSTLRGGGNRSGADAVTTWQTGYPAAVDFARGHPRYAPYDGAADARLARGEVDAVLVLGDAALVPPAVAAALGRVPCVVIGPRASAGPLAAGAAALVDSGVAGIHDAGTAFRLDDVPLPLRAVLAGPPSAEGLARALLDRLTRARPSGAPTTSADQLP